MRWLARLPRTQAISEFHVRNILSGLNAIDRTHAVTIALKRRFIDL